MQCRRRHGYRIYIVVACSVVSLAGCSPGEQRQSIEGAITLDGQPLQVGNITFQPESGTHGPNAGAAIDAGKYSIAAKGGTFAGRFRVEITSTRPSGRMITDRDGTMVPGQEQFLPKKYNAESELHAEVKPGELNHFNFELTSK